MPQLQNPLFLAAGQHLGNVQRAETLAGADDGGEYLLGHFGSVAVLRFRQADIAAAAVVRRPAFPEILQNVAAAASGQLGELHHLRQFQAGVALLDGILHLIDEIVLLGFVGVVVEQDALAGQAVPPGPAGFLIVAFQRLGQAVVNHQADVRLVDAHTESDGGNDNRHPVADKILLGLAAGIGVQAGVVRAGSQAPGVQVISQFLGFPAGKAVDDGGLLALFLQQGQQSAPGVALGHYGVAEVVPVKARQENPPLLQIQLADDVGAHPFRSGGGEGNDRRLGKVPPQGAQVAVIRAELMPPFGNAVGFVNGDEAQFQMFQKVAETGQSQPFRGYIENLDFAPGGGGPHPVNF